LALFYQRSADPFPWIGPMNLLSRDKQIEIIAALTEGVGIRRAPGVGRV
jgi:hypothetical protein